ncbi:MAG: hypothetical protein OXE86_06710 [Alphaproteobacteria bacterium]|nr:hypothetical protein [Alphaproteobacteria bacterium]
MLIFTQVIDKLREDDAILVMSSSEFLDVEVSHGLWSERQSFQIDSEYMTPMQRLTLFAPFVWKLHNHSKKMKKLPLLPDPRNPDSAWTFKVNEDIILAFCSDNPVWYWEKKDDSWQLYIMRVLREDNMDDSLGIDELIRELENYEHEDEGTRNDPENLTPDPLLGVFKHFLRVLTDGHAQLDKEPYFPDPANPNSEYRFRSNGQFVVAYRRISDSDCQPAWCWRRQENGSWKLYRIRISVRPDIELLDSSVELELENGTWN